MRSYSSQGALLSIKLRSQQTAGKRSTHTEEIIRMGIVPAVLCPWKPRGCLFGDFARRHNASALVVTTFGAHHVGRNGHADATFVQAIRAESQLAGLQAIVSATRAAAGIRLFSFGYCHDRVSNEGLAKRKSLASLNLVPGRPRWITPIQGPVGLTSNESLNKMRHNMQVETRNDTGIPQKRQ